MIDQYRNVDSFSLPADGKIEIERELVRDDDFNPGDYLFQDGDCRKEDQARLDAFERCEWHGIGVRAKVTIYVPIGKGSFATYTLTSPGVWGIESDSEEEFFAEVFEEEKAHLIKAIVKIGELAKCLK